MFAFDVTLPAPSDSVYIAVERGTYSLSVATTVLSTIIIAIRILMVSRIPGGNRQRSIAVEIIVESAVRYSISAVVYTSMIPPISWTGSSATHYLYAGVFFRHMAVES
jgi:phosphatidylserine synthase